jgi:hypothetical protein
MHSIDATPNAKAICGRRGSSIGPFMAAHTTPTHAWVPGCLHVTHARMPGCLGPSPTYSRAR